MDKKWDDMNLKQEHSESADLYQGTFNKYM